MKLQLVEQDPCPPTFSNMPKCGAYFSLKVCFVLHAGRGGGGPAGAGGAGAAGGAWRANADCVAPTASAPAVASRKRRLCMAGQS